MNPTLCDLVGGIQTVTLSDEEARRRRTQKSVLERKARQKLHHRDVYVSTVGGARGGDPATDLPIGSSEKNLKSAVAGETHEYTDMYPGMAKAARDEGFDEIADWFETLAKAERSHANRFQKALDVL